MIEAIRQLARELPLEESYNWKIPTDTPIKIPDECEGSFARNVFLKENLHQQLRNDPELQTHFWIIREWGAFEPFRGRHVTSRESMSFTINLRFANSVVGHST